MNPPGDGTEPHDPNDDAALGPPVTELRDVSLAVGDRFVTRVRGRIERRVLTGDLLELAWNAPLTVVLEFLRWPIDGLATRGDNQQND